MARYALNFSSVTTAASGYANAANFASGGYPFILQGGNSTQQLRVDELNVDGEASASAVQILKLARDSTVGATVTAGACFNTLVNAGATAPGTVAIFGNSSTTQPQRGTNWLLSISFNAYGGLYRWQARQGEEFVIVGNAVNVGEMSFSPFTGNAAAAVSGHCLYELV